jgi:hypothetical protein
MPSALIHVLCVTALSLSTTLAWADSDWKNLMPEGEGKAQTLQLCSACHTLEKVVVSKKTPKEWERSVNDMVARGAQIFPDEAELIIKYLTKNFGSNPAK